MRHDNASVTAADKILVYLIFMVTILISAIITYTVTTIIHKNKIIEPIDPLHKYMNPMQKIKMRYRT